MLRSDCYPRRYRVPNFNKRHYLDKLANFCANKVFHIVKEDMPKKIEISFDNCEHINKIKLTMSDFGLLLCGGSIDFTKIPDTIYLNICIPIDKIDFCALYMGIANAIRHELQHVLQFYYVTNKYVEETCLTTGQFSRMVKNGYHVWEADEKYFSSQIELEANVKSAMYIAKKTGQDINEAISNIFDKRKDEVKLIVRKTFWDTIETEYAKIHKSMSDFAPKCYDVSTIFMKNMAPRL